MTLPALANVIAVRSQDPDELARVEARLRADSSVGDVHRPAPGWVAARAVFHRSRAEPPEIRRARLLFAEGVETVAADGAAALVARALSRPASLHEQQGDFTFLAFDEHGDASAVRSCSGRVPLYVTRDRRGPLTVATTLELLLRHHPRRLEIDPLINAIYLSGYDAAPERRALISGVLVVQRGSAARLARNASPTCSTYWRPRSAGPPVRSPAGHADELRELLVATVRDNVDPSGGNLLTLSGGVDSSAIGALVAGLCGAPLETVTVMPSDPASRARDLGFIDTLDAEVGLARQTRLGFDSRRRLELLDAPNVPYHVLQPFLCVLPGVLSEHASHVLFGGEFADHTVGSLVTMRDWARHMTLGDLRRSRHALPTGRADVRRWAMYRVRRLQRRPVMPWPDDLPDMTRPELRAEYREWHDRRRRAAAADDGPMPYLAMLLERDGFLAMHWEICSALGLRRILPFVTRPVLELAFRTHPSDLVGPGTKLLLRRALRGLVPDANLDRVDKGHVARATDRGDQRAPEDVPDTIRAVIREQWPDALQVPYMDLFRLRQLLAFIGAVDRARLGVPRQEQGIV